MAERCDRFQKTPNTALRGGLKNCGLCVRRDNCSEVRDVNDNGRTRYPGVPMNTEWLKGESGAATAPTTRSPRDGAGHFSSDH